MSFIINPYRFGGPPSPLTQSIDFNGSSQYLSMSEANFGAFTKSKWAIAGSLYRDNTSNHGIWCKGDGVSGIEAILTTFGSNLYFQTRNSDGSSGNNTWIQSNGGQFGSGAYRAFMVHYDGNNATANSRLRMWIDNTEVGLSRGSVAANGDIIDYGTIQIEVGRNNNGGSGELMDGKIFSLAFFNNYLPTAAEIFLGSSGKLKDFTSLTGLFSWLDVAGGSVISDYVKATDWTNNGTATASSTIP